MQPSSSKDGEALHKFPQFDTRINILCGLKTEKAPELFIECCIELDNLQNHDFYYRLRWRYRNYTQASLSRSVDEAVQGTIMYSTEEKRVWCNVGGRMSALDVRSFLATNWLCAAFSLLAWRSTIFSNCRHTENLSNSTGEAQFHSFYSISLRLPRGFFVGAAAKGKSRNCTSRCGLANRPAPWLLFQASYPWLKPASRLQRTAIQQRFGSLHLEAVWPLTSTTGDHDMEQRIRSVLFPRDLRAAPGKVQCRNVRQMELRRSLLPLHHPKLSPSKRSRHLHPICAPSCSFGDGSWGPKRKSWTDLNLSRAPAGVSGRHRGVTFRLTPLWRWRWTDRPWREGGRVPYGQVLALAALRDRHNDINECWWCRAL